MQNSTDIDLSKASTVEAEATPEKTAKRLPGEEGVWVFVFGDMMVFSLLFGSYAWYRIADIELFRESQALLNQTFGVINTLLLLSGSLCVVLALHLARSASMQSKEIQQAVSTKVVSLLVLAIGTGLSFFICKIFEYREKINAGYTLVTNDFFMYYFMLTGIHLLHVCAGIGVLIFLCLRSTKGLYNDKDIRNFESGGAIWHMVDLLWIMLFPLLYLIY